MKKITLLIAVLLSLFIFISPSFSMENSEIDDQFSYAQTRSDDLRLSIYITAHAINDLLANEAGRREAISIFRGNGITKAYIEVYRSGLEIEKSLLEKVRDSFRACRWVRFGINSDLQQNTGRTTGIHILEYPSDPKNTRDLANDLK